MSSAVWYWREGETQRGPVTWEKLQSMAVSGQVAPNDWIFREGWTDWKLACEAKDWDLQAIPAPPDPPPLPVLPQAVLAPVAPLVPTMQAAPPLPLPPAEMLAAPALMSNAAAVPLPPAAPVNLPLPPLAPQDTVGDFGPPPPSADGVTDGDVNHLRRVLRDGPEPEQPVSEANFLAIGALAAALVGLMFLALEMGLVAVALGGWCLYASSTTGNSNGKSLAIGAVAIGFFNVIFRILCATVDMGLTM
jgi:GYF domain 2